MKVLLFFCTFSILVLSPLLTSNFYNTHDGQNHVVRFATFNQAVNDGHLPVRWAGNLHYEYGSPVLNFFYPLPNYLSLVPSFLNISYESTFKLLIASAFLLSFLTFFAWMQNHVGRTVAYAGAFIYGLSPYHFLNLYVRGDIGELFALAFAPLVLFAVDSLVRKNTYEFGVLTAISFSLLVLSHNGVSLIFAPVIFFYLLFKTRDIKNIFIVLSWLFFGLMLSAFFWLPALYEQKFVNAQLFIGDFYKGNFPRLLTYIYSNWGFGSNVNDVGGLSPQLGIVQLLIAVILIIKRILDKSINSHIFFWICIFFAAFFVSTKFSQQLWESISFLRVFQFPWRFTALSSFALAAITCLLLKNINKKILYTSLFFIIFYSIQFVKVIPIESKENTFYQSFHGTTYFHGEASSVWSAGDFSQIPQDNIEIIEGSGEVTQYERKNHYHEYKVTTSSKVKIRDNTLYYPGWKVFANEVEVPVEFQDINHRGVLTYKLDEGQNNVRVIFTETKFRTLSNLISMASFLFLISTYFLIMAINRFK